MGYEDLNSGIFVKNTKRAKVSMTQLSNKALGQKSQIINIT